LAYLEKNEVYAELICILIVKKNKFKSMDGPINIVVISYITKNRNKFKIF
jgi:hypothetical protein